MEASWILRKANTLTLLLGSMILVGCASAPNKYQTPSQRQQAIELLSKGEVRLMCDSLSCAGSYGSTRHIALGLYKQELWVDLAIHVINNDYNINQGYYYLGRAAEALKSPSAAKTYYKLSAVAHLNCDGVIDVCDDINISKEITASYARMDSPNYLTNADAPKQVRAPTAPAELVSTMTPAVQKLSSTQLASTTNLTPANAAQGDAQKIEPLNSKEDQGYFPPNPEIKNTSIESNVQKKSSVPRVATDEERSILMSAFNGFLLDYESAKFGNIYIAPGEGACALVNAKNSFGGYVGYKWYYILHTDSMWVVGDLNFDLDGPWCIRMLESAAKE